MGFCRHQMHGNFTNCGREAFETFSHSLLSLGYFDSGAKHKFSFLVKSNFFESFTHERASVYTLLIGILFLLHIQIQEKLRSSYFNVKINTLCKKKCQNILHFF